MSTYAIVGATGFVGTALTLRLLDLGHHVVALSRGPRKWPLQHKNLKVIKGDLLEGHAVEELLKDVDAAYFLMHALNSNDDDFEWAEARAATNFAAAATKAKLKKTIFLGALGPDGDISSHLRSRHLVGDILGLSASACIEFRASIVLGPNSASFEMIKALTQRLPVRPYAPWLETPCQPIGMDDLLSFLVAALDAQVIGHRVIEIGSPQVVPYGELLDMYAKRENLIRPKFLLPVTDQRHLLPFLDLLVPEFSEVGKKLFLSLDYPTVVADRSAEDLFPEIQPISLDEAMKYACENSQTEYPAVWEGDFWKELKDHTLLQTRQGQQILLDKFKELTDSNLPMTAVEMLKDKFRKRKTKKKEKES